MSTGADSPDILTRLNDGRVVPCYTCECGHCHNEWFVPGYSQEWMPSFCPYCGIKFTRRAEGEFKPAPKGA